MTKMTQSLYLRAIKTLPDYFIDDETRFAPVDDFRMVVANPRFKAMWYDGDRKKPKWKVIDQNSPFIFENGELKMKE